MKRMIYRSVWWSMVLLFAVACSTTKAQDPVTKISHQQLKELKGHTTIQLLDVQTPEEVSFGVIGGAIVIDFYDPAFTEKVKKLDKEKPVVVYCAVGGRSASASSRLRDMGFSEIYDLAGGFRSWKAAGYPIKNKD